jgi:hypothetical protein
MAQEKEPFLARWSRLKHEQAKAEPAPAPKKPEEPAPALPPVEKLTPESDFAPFMHPKVEDALRRAALKKLFSDPHFNAADPFEAYSGDWTGGEPISKELLATLNQARSVLFPEQEKTGETEKKKDEQTAQADRPEEGDGAGRKDA